MLTGKLPAFRRRYCKSPSPVSLVYSSPSPIHRGQLGHELPFAHTISLRHCSPSRDAVGAAQCKPPQQAYASQDVGKDWLCGGTPLSVERRYEWTAETHEILNYFCSGTLAANCTRCRGVYTKARHFCTPPPVPAVSLSSVYRLARPGGVILPRDVETKRAVARAIELYISLVWEWQFVTALRSGIYSARCRIRALLSASCRREQNMCSGPPATGIPIPGAGYPGRLADRQEIRRPAPHPSPATPHRPPRDLGVRRRRRIDGA